MKTVQSAYDVCGSVTDYICEIHNFITAKNLSLSIVLILFTTWTKEVNTSFNIVTRIFKGNILVNITGLMFDINMMPFDYIMGPSNHITNLSYYHILLYSSFPINEPNYCLNREVHNMQNKVDRNSSPCF